MAISKVKTLKDGTKRVVFEFRKIHPVTKKVIYQSQVFTLDSTLSPARQKKQMEEAHRLFIEEREQIVSNGGFLGEYTVEQYAYIYLDYLKETKSLSYYQRWKVLLPFIVDELGKAKLRELNPIIIQEFINKAAKKTKIEVHCYPKKDIQELLTHYGITNEILAEKKLNGFQYNLMCDEMPVQKRWAETFARKLSIPFKELGSVR